MIAITKTTAITETIAQKGDTLELTVDSGTEVHVIPFKWVTKLMKWEEGPKLIMRSAGGEQLRHYGRVEVLLQVGAKLFKIYWEVVDARRALLSVSAMLDNGWEVHFGHGKYIIRNGANEVDLKRRGGLYLLEGEVKDARLTTDMTEVLVMPVEGIPQPTLLEDDIEEMTGTLRAAGVSVFSEPVRVPAGLVKFASGSKTLVYFLDPDGVMVELAEYR